MSYQTPYLASLAILMTCSLAAPAEARRSPPSISSAPTSGLQYTPGDLIWMDGSQELQTTAESGLVAAGSIGGDDEDPPGDSDTDEVQWNFEEENELTVLGGQVVASPGAPLTSQSMAAFSADCAWGEAEAGVSAIPMHRMVATSGGIGASYVHQGMEPLEAYIDLPGFDPSCVGHSGATTSNQSAASSSVAFEVEVPTLVLIRAELITVGASAAEDTNRVRASGSWSLSGPVDAGCTLELDRPGDEEEEGSPAGGDDPSDGDDDDDDGLGNAGGEEEEDEEDEEEQDEDDSTRTIRTGCTRTLLLEPGGYSFSTSYTHDTAQAVSDPGIVTGAMLMHQEAFTANLSVLEPIRPAFGTRSKGRR